MYFHFAIQRRVLLKMDSVVIMDVQRDFESVIPLTHEDITASYVPASFDEYLVKCATPDPDGTQIRSHKAPMMSRCDFILSANQI